MKAKQGNYLLEFSINFIDTRKIFKLIIDWKGKQKPRHLARL